MSDAARALVSAEIGGNLDVAVHTGKRCVLRVASSFIELAFSPVTSVQQVKLGDSVLEPTEYDVHRFGIQTVDGFWPAGCAVTVDYTTGWAVDAEPQDIKQALVIIDKWLETQPEAGVKSYSEGGVSVSRESYETIPNMAKGLLKSWVKP